MAGFKSRITPHQENRIWTIYSRGKTTQVQLAEQFGVCQQRISVIICRKREAVARVKK